MTPTIEAGGAYPPIAEVLPHRGAMLWLDELVSVEGHEVICRVTLEPERTRSIEGAPGGLLAPELFAQTAGALFGYRAWLEGLPFEGGAFVGARRIVFHVDELPVGVPLTVRAVEDWTVDQLSHMSCRLEGPEGALAEASITVAVGRSSDSLR